MFLQFILHNLPTILAWLSSGLVELYLQILNYSAGLSVFKVSLYLVALNVVFISMAMMHQKRLRESIISDVSKTTSLEKARQKKLEEMLAVAEVQFAELQAQVEAGELSEEGVPKSPNELLPPELLVPVEPLQTMYRRRWWVEIFYSWGAIALAPITFPIAVLVQTVKFIIQLFREAEEPTTNYLVFSTGPSYVRAAQIVTGIYLIAVVLDPLLAAQNHLSLGASYWEFLLLGQNTALASLLPLSHFPSLSLSLHFVLWTILWWTTAQGIRLMSSDAVYRNNFEHINDIIETTHPNEESLVEFRAGWMNSWRTWSGHRDGWRAGYASRWQKWLVPLGFVCLAIGFTALEGDPYRLPSGAWVIGLISWVTLFLNLSLEGAFHFRKESKPMEVPQQSSLPGWPEVLSVMREEPSRMVHSNPEFYYIPPNPFDDGVPLSSISYINPLLADVQLSDAEETLLNPYQVEMLNRFHSALQRYTTVSIAGEVQEELSLNKTLVYENDSDKRNWLTVLPDGYGKTQMLFLLAAHFYLSTSQRSIILTRDNQQAERLFRRFEGILAGDTLRWSVPIALANNDFYGSVQDQFFPAITIISIEELGLHLLPKLTSRSDVPLSQYLSSIGLVLFEDLESHLGTIEQHTYFTFRRLLLQLYRSRNFPLSTDIWSPFVIGFASDSMFNQRVWASSLIGLDFEIFHPKIEVTYHTDLDEVSFVDEDNEEVQTEDDAEIKTGHVVQYFKHTQFKGYSFHEIIAICEEQKVPWTFRVCGDGNRDLGLEALVLSNEPMFYKNDIFSSAVILLTGHYTDIQRETKRILRLGTRFCQYLDKEGRADPSRGVTPIAVISQADEFESLVFESQELEPSLKESMLQFPLPLVRKSGPWVLRAHMAADLVRFWIEVEDLVQVFGIEAGMIVQRLQRSNLLMLESRKMINEAVSAYTSHVIVRAKRTALPSSKADSLTSRLPYPVNCVETASHFPVDVFDQTSSRVLMKIDANSAALSFYLGRIWSTYFGRYIVKELLFVDEVLPTGEKHLELRKILVEPTLSNEISTPRRQFFFANRPDVENELEFRLYGERGIGVALQEYFDDREVALEQEVSFSTQCKVTHLPTATLYLEVQDSNIKERRLLTLKEKQHLQHIQELHTDGLWFFPCFSPKEDVEPASLSLGGARILVAIFRMLLPNIYRGGEEVELTVGLKDTEIELGQLDYSLTVEDALVLFDLQQEGSGAVRCIHREGLLLMIEFARAFLRPCTDLEVFMRKYDHCPDDSELYKGQQQLNWNSSRENLLAWFEMVLPNKSKEKPPTPAPPAPKDVPKEALPLLLEVPDPEPQTSWQEVAERLVAKVAESDGIALLQMRLHSLDRTIEGFVPVSSSLEVRSTRYGHEIELSKDVSVEELVEVFQSIHSGEWSSDIEGWFHLYQSSIEMEQTNWDKPVIGEPGRYAVMDPKHVRSLIRTILPNVESIALSSIDKRMQAMCEIFDWMHQNIRYEKDMVLYASKEYIATPEETLRHGMGDCEDHANLIAAFALEIGIVPRIALVTKHALCELYLGKSEEVNVDAIEAVIRGYLQRKADEFGLEFGQWPYSQGKFSHGWRRDGLSVVRDGGSKYGFYSFEFNGIQIIETDGEMWVLLDDCFGGSFIGHASTHIRDGYILPGTTSWVEEHFDSYHYPSEEWIQQQEARLFRRANISLETPPAPPAHFVLRGQVLAEGLGSMTEMEIHDLVKSEEIIDVVPLPTEMGNAIAQYKEESESVVSEPTPAPTVEPTPDSAPDVVEPVAEDPATPEEPTPLDDDGVEADVVEDDTPDTEPVEDVTDPEEEPTTSETLEESDSPTVDDEPEVPESETTLEEPSEPVPPSNQLVVNVLETKMLSAEKPVVQGEHGLNANFQFRGQVYAFTWGFSSVENLNAYRETVSPTEISLESCFQLDLYPNAIQDVLDNLLVIYGGKADAFFTEFVLSFVHALPADTSRKGLYKTPSQTLLFGGTNQEFAVLMMYLSDLIGQNFFIAKDDQNRYGGVMSGPYSGYHVLLGEAQKYFFVDIAHNKTGPGMCTWTSIQEWILQEEPVRAKQPIKVNLRSVEDSVAEIDLFGDFDGSKIWMVLNNLSNSEVLVTDLQLESTAADQIDQVRISIPVVESGEWILYLTDGTSILGQLHKQPDDSVDPESPEPSSEPAPTDLEEDGTEPVPTASEDEV